MWLMISNSIRQEKQKVYIKTCKIELKDEIRSFYFYLFILGYKKASISGIWKTENP